jgi:hypothetical protein
MYENAVSVFKIPEMANCDIFVFPCTGKLILTVI